MNISNITFILILSTVSFVTYIICSYTLSCDINCSINYNKVENRTDTPHDNYDNQLANQIMINNMKKREIRDIENQISSTKKHYKKKRHVREAVHSPPASHDNYIENLLFS